MKKQHENILKAIIGYVEKHGYPPTVREIGEATCLKSTSSVHCYLKEMFALGILETDAEFSNPRAIRVPNYVFVKKEALEKQIPKVATNIETHYIPESYETDYVTGNCPSCGVSFAGGDFDDFYCHKCGQLVSWDDE